mgnify:CR=1 FL=1
MKKQKRLAMQSFSIAAAKDYNPTMLIAQAFAIVSYVPAGMIASKVDSIKDTVIASNAS